MTPDVSLEMLKSFKSQPSVRLKLGSSRGKSGYGQMGREVSQSQESREGESGRQETKPWFIFLYLNITIL